MPTQPLLVSPLYPKAGPQIQDRRPCGCIADPVVFGHDRHTCTLTAADAA